MSDGNIQAAKTKLCLAVGRLIDRRPGIYHDATHYAPSLYDCLVSDLPGTQGDNKSPAKSMPPVWIDALQLRGDIDTQTHKWVPRLKDTPNRLGFLKHHSWRPQDTDNVTSITTGRRMVRENPQPPRTGKPQRDHRTLSFLWPAHRVPQRPRRGKRPHGRTGPSGRQRLHLPRV